MVLSVPIGIAAGLAVNPIQRWWERRGQHSQAERQKQKKAEYEKALYYVLHPEMMIASFVLKGTFATVFAVYLLILMKLEPYADVFFAVFLKAHHEVPVGVVLTVTSLAALLFIAMTIYVVILSARSVTVYFRVRGFWAYAETLPAEVRDREFESFVKETVRNRTLGILKVGRDRNEI
jgi:hypothetical protein